MSEPIDDLSNERERLVSLATDEFMERIECGETVDIDDFVAKFPAVQEVLRRLLPALEILRQSKPGDHAETSNLLTDDIGQALGTDSRLGDFQVIREVGRGGMGVVYEAHQLSLNRNVALKILPFASTLDPNRIRRFRNEALAVASLDHPSIAEIYGVGCERGLHYYAMRLIDGPSLAEVLVSLKRGAAAPASTLDSERQQQSTQKLSDSDRTPESLSKLGKPYLRAVAELVAAIANALDHAHQLGIVHRDVKPGNLMVDSAGKPWITDFGLAQISTGESLTISGDLLGTLRYMAPEQIDSGTPVDHRADIYALGTTLYELLTLKPMIQAADRLRIIEQVRDKTPLSASRLNPDIPRELETIIQKATEKEPSNRYQTAGALASDLRAWLDGKPIAARPSSDLSKAWRWCKRNSLVASLIAAIILVSLTTAIISTTLSIKANDALQAERQAKVRESAALEKEKAARHEIQEALRSEKQARAVADQNAKNQIFTVGVLTSAFKAASPGQSGTAKVTALDVLRAAVEELDRPMQHSQPDDLTKAKLLNSIGDAMAGLAEYDDATKILERAVAIRRKELGASDIGVSVSLNSLSYIYQLSGRFEEALELAEEAYEMAQAIHPNRPETMSALDNLGQAYGRLENYAEAEKYCRDALERRLKMIGPNSADAATSRNNLAYFLSKNGSVDEAIELHKTNLEIYAGKYGERHTSTIATNVNYARALMDRGQVDEAVTILRRQFEIAEDLMERSHPTTCSCVNSLASGLRKQGNYAEAITLLETNRTVLTERFGKDHAAPVTALGNLAIATFRSGDHESAWPLLETWVDSTKRVRGSNSLVTRKSLVSVAGCYRTAGRMQRAVDHYTECLQLPPPRLGENAELTLATFGLLDIGFQLDQVGTSLREHLLTLQTESISDQAAKDDVLKLTLKLTLLLGTSLVCQEQFSECESILDSLSAIPLKRSAIEQAHVDFLGALVLAKDGTLESVEEKLVQSAEFLCEQAKTDSDRALGQWMAKRLVNFYTEIDNKEAADRWADMSKTLNRN